MFYELVSIELQRISESSMKVSLKSWVGPLFFIAGSAETLRFASVVLCSFLLWIVSPFNSFRGTYSIYEKLTWCGNYFHIFHFWKIIVSEETICGHTVFYYFRNVKTSMQLGNVFLWSRRYKCIIFGQKKKNSATTTKFIWMLNSYFLRNVW